MANPRRQRIVEELISIFQKITKLYGHKTNLGSNITEWKTTNTQEEDLPCMDVRDTSEEVEVKGSLHYYKLTIELKAKVQASTSTQVAREVIADVITIMGKNCTVNGLAYNVTPIENELLDFEKADKKFGTISLQFTVWYRTKAFQPYS